ncbi:cell division-specific peptidoglycan biosynthesis regulator FtsW [Plasticicumulans lactativorans]|uniref:Probable peptidoglycan glycosyltransferase FtsW n=1 Tax=Plasticicumulans lactativorans TaxID=1133106 RepID=A0A4R2L156_9GAMM|nr:putative lipid II flippase FtsW [Plasticicumulans lactativorans]TCO80174.1 cell division-specific peptidoglycan biosynthesis regulator FtsW [Plasticicumulans lactativorans]
MLNIAGVLARVRPPRTEDSTGPLPPLDPWLVFPALLLLALGVLMVTSASMPIADRQAGQPFYFLYRQCAYVTLGVVLGYFAYHINTETWYQRGPMLLLVVMGLLVLVLVPGIGRRVNGSWRWIPLGIMNVQVSELAKLFAIVYVAGYLRRHGAELRTSIVAMIRPLLVLGVLALLLLMEPDFGAAMVIIFVALGMVFLGGVNFWQFSAMQLLVVSGMAVLLWSSPYRRARLSSFLNPWEDPFNKGFQLTQSLIAIGRGEMSGVGIGASVQKLFYLPEAYTDFVFAIIAEELGLLGVLALIGLYTVVVVRAFQVGARAERVRQPFAASLAYGIGLWIGFQALINMGVNMGVLPTKGLTLPFISFGGSSLVVMCVAYALLLRADVETRHDENPRLRRDRLLRKVRAP